MLAPFVLSSTKIRARVSAALVHLGVVSEDAAKTLVDGGGDAADRDPDDKRAVVLLHARPRDVCKLITIAELVKRALGVWFQYNELFLDGTLPAAKTQEEEEDDGFETMDKRFENAVLGKETQREDRALRIFLARGPVPELATREGVTVQTNRG